MRSYLKAVLLSLVLALAGTAEAKPGCITRMWNPLTDIDYSNMGGIRVAGMSVMSDPSSLGKNANMRADPICKCGWGAGVALQFWAPSYIMDVARSAGCLGFLNMDILPGFTASGNSGQETAFHDPRREGVTLMQTHWAYADIMQLAGKQLFEKCGGMTSEFSLAYLTEVDFLWHNDVTAAIMAPYNSLIAAAPMLGQLMCGLESAANSIGGWQDSRLCAWAGSRFPLSGNAQSKDSAMVTNMDVGVKFLARQTLLGTVLKTTGNKAICKPTYDPMWQSEEWRFQWAYPAMTTTRFNQNVMKWGMAPGLTGDSMDINQAVAALKAGGGLNVDVSGQAAEGGGVDASMNSMATNIVSKIPKPLNYPTREAGFMQAWQARQCCLILVSVESIVEGIIKNMLAPGAEAAQWMKDVYAMYQYGQEAYQLITDPIGAAMGYIGGAIGDGLDNLTGGALTDMSKSLKETTGGVLTGIKTSLTGA